MTARALFLDRDGVINVDADHVHRIADFAFIPGVFETLTAFQAEGYLLIIVTNQGGIGRGLYTETDFRVLTDWMLREFAIRHITISKVYFSPCHPIHGVGTFKRDSYFRKPNPGMILQAQKDFDLNLVESVLVGDKESDIEAGNRAGVGTLVLLTPPGSKPVSKANHIVSTISELISLL